MLNLRIYLTRKKRKLFFTSDRQLALKTPCNDNNFPINHREFIAEMRRVKKVIDKKCTKRGFVFPSIADIWLNQFNNKNNSNMRF